MNLLDRLAPSTTLAALVRAVGSRGHVTCRGSHGSSTALLAGALARATGRTVLLAIGHVDEAIETADEIMGGGGGGRGGDVVEAIVLPALESLPGESVVGAEQMSQRLSGVRRMLALKNAPKATNAPGLVVVTPIQALMQAAPRAEELARLVLVLSPGDTRGPGEIGGWLADAGYRRADAIEEPGDFALRGGIMDVFGVGGVGPVRLDFFGDELERIAEIDLDSMGSDRARDTVELARVSGDGIDRARGVLFAEHLPADAIAMVHELLEINEQGRGYYERVIDPDGIFGPPAVLKGLREHCASFVEVNQYSPGTSGGTSRDGASALSVEVPVGPLPAFSRDVEEAVRELGALAGDGPEGRATLVACRNAGELQRFQELLREFAPDAVGRVEAGIAPVQRGFLWGEGGDGSFALVPYHELVHRFEVRRGRLSTRGAGARDTFLAFEAGDHVVHREHGIAKFIGLETIKPRRVGAQGPVMPGEKPKKTTARARTEDEEEYLTLEFANRARLKVPATKIDQVQKYVGGKGEPTLSVLGGQRWRSQKARVFESVRDLAGEMLRVRAAREAIPGVRFPGDTAWQREFEAEFPYEETDDQLASLAEIKKDMASDRPMDRLVCGDVGYGKTELAIRAAFKCVEFGKQVAVLVPTTVLAEQHEQTFKRRMADYPFRVESLSRFKTTQEVNRTLAALRRGEVDVIIGTHRLVSKDVRFADLGLVVIDEEQRFGVEHKERLLQLRVTADVLTLSATPIPRTLHMAMLGLRDISSLTTPPVDRRAVVTEVVPWNESRLKQAIARELSREGQVFYVHNRVYDIQSAADDVQKLAPDARIVIGHGQMGDRELEKVMLAFMRREADILVSTTIIESGIDIPTANTMIIDDAHRFGLADLHQLRGRVGRWRHRAYCYLLLPKDQTVGKKGVERLKAIEQFSMLGAGFKIAMRDLEIRGAGNILGPEQSGHIAAVGYEMYCQLLEQAVRELRHEPTARPSDTSVELGPAGMIPRGYIPSDRRRMDAYRRLAGAASAEELDRFEQDIRQAYGEPPRAVERLVEIADLRAGASRLGVRTVTLRERDVVLRVDPGSQQGVRERLADAKGSVTVLEPKKGEDAWEIYYRPPEGYLERDTLIRVLRSRLGVRAGVGA